MSKIQNFYTDQKVFITGGTGFLGSVLVEKLLRSTNIATIYFLIRSKKSESINERLHKVFDNAFFEKLKEERPNFLKKIIPINGDLRKPGLGISREDRNNLVENVNVIFHVAATIRLEANLKTAYLLNFSATRVIVQLCKEIKNLKVFVYVSTIYCNFHRDIIEEKIYNHPANYDELGERLEKLSPEEADKLTPEIISPYLSTYAFTKALSESLIKKELAHLPVGIFRPGLVISSYSEPIAGWNSSWSALSQMTIGIGLGLTRNIQIPSNIPIEIVPVDTCIPALIAVGWDVTNNATYHIPVYNFASSVENPITYKEYFDNSFDYFPFHPSKIVWKPQVNYTSSKFYYGVMRQLTETLPGLLLDFASLTCGQNPTMLSYYKSFHKVVDVTTKFTMRRSELKTENVQGLWAKMGDEDRNLFSMSLALVSWPEFFQNYWQGIRLFMLKQDDASLETDKIQFHRLQIAHQLLKFLYFIAAIYVAKKVMFNAKF